MVARATLNPLLSAPITATLARFALPNMLAMLASAMSTMAETAYVGSLGVHALAGMALVFPMVMLQTMLANGAMGGGVSSSISRALGAGQPDRANALAVHAMWIGLVAGVLATLGMLVFGPAIYTLLGGQGETLTQALAYSNVAFLSSVGMWLTSTFASVIRGSGNMKVPSITFLSVAVAQVLIGGALGLGWWGLPRGGMAGVAMGQVLAFAASALFLFFYLRSGRLRVRLDVRQTPLQSEPLRDILRVGALACLSPLQTVLTILILTRLVSHFGTNALAGYGIGTRLEFLLVPLAFAIGVASSPMVGMAVGAGMVTRARRVAWTAATMGLVLLTVLGGVVTLVPELWSRLFTQDAEVISSASLYFLWAGPCYGLFGMGLVLYFSSMGAGKVGGPVLAGTVRLVLVAVGGWLLTQAHAPVWTIYALVALGMVVYGLATAAAIWFTSWGTDR